MIKLVKEKLSKHKLILLASVNKDFLSLSHFYHFYPVPSPLLREQSIVHVWHKNNTRSIAIWDVIVYCPYCYLLLIVLTLNLSLHIPGISFYTLWHTLVNTKLSIPWRRGMSLRQEHGNMDSGNLTISVPVGLGVHFWSLKNSGNRVVSMQCPFWGIIYLLFSLWI